MPENIENKLVDKRVVHRYIRKGRIDEKDYEGHLKKLPDLADRSVAVESEIPRGSGEKEREE